MIVIQFAYALIGYLCGLKSQGCPADACAEIGSRIAFQRINQC